MLEELKIEAAKAWYGYSETPFHPAPELANNFGTVVRAVLTRLLDVSPGMVEAAHDHLAGDGDVTTLWKAMLNAVLSEGTDNE